MAVLAAVAILVWVIINLPMVLVFSVGAVVGLVVVGLLLKLVFGIIGVFQDRG